MHPCAAFTKYVQMFMTTKGVKPARSAGEAPCIIIIAKVYWYMQIAKVCILVYAIRYIGICKLQGISYHMITNCMTNYLGHSLSVGMAFLQKVVWPWPNAIFMAA